MYYLLSNSSISIQLIKYKKNPGDDTLTDKQKYQILSILKYQISPL